MLKDKVEAFMSTLEMYINKNIAARAKYGITEDNIKHLVSMKAKLVSQLVEILEEKAL